MKRRLLYILAAGGLFFWGCEGSLQKPRRICAGKSSVEEALTALKSNRQEVVSLKANGQCLAEFSTDGKKEAKKEKFFVKLWVDLPLQIRLHGDVAFDARGIDIGCNEDEFWLIMKPKEFRGYYWGKWSEQSNWKGFRLKPKLVLEALGGVMDEVDEGWSLSRDSAFDVLTQKDAGGVVIKKIYIDSCSYHVFKTEYYDAEGKVAVFTELYNYRKIAEGLFVPMVVKIVGCSESGRRDSFEITLNSVEAKEFSQENKRIYFSRPKSEGFRPQFRVVEGELIEQQ